MWKNFKHIFEAITFQTISRFFAILAAAVVGLVYVVRRDWGAEIIPIVAIIFTVALGFIKLIYDVQKESKDYARKLDTRRGSSEQSPEVAKLLSRLHASNSRQLRQAVEQLRAELEIPKTQLPDTSDPDKLFQVARQRLLDEAVRIDSISRRNLTLGVAFSAFALAFLAWPLLAQTLFQPPGEAPNYGVMQWIVQYYLPRFAVGVLLQFVGFFFLRLYVANELDLKHNKNEITNIEMKMMGLHLARSFGDAPSKKELIKSLANTERNFILKRNEKSVSTEAIAEYNDVKGIIEKLINKIPGRAQ